LSKVLLRYRICDAGLVTWWQATATAAVSAAACLFLRLSFPVAGSPYVVALAAVLLVATWLLNKALQEGDASTVVPLLGLKIPFASIMAWLLLKESVSAGLWFAVLFSGGAVAFFGLGGQQVAQGGHGRKPVVAILLAVFAALLFSLADIIARASSASMDTITLVLWANVIWAPISVIMLLCPRYRKYRVGGADFWMCLSYGIFVTGAVLALYYSFTLADSVVLPNIIIGTRGVFALIAGYVFSKAAKVPIERQDGRVYVFRAAGTVLIVISLLLLKYSG